MAESDDDLCDLYVARERFVDRALDPNDPAIFFMGAKGVGKSAVLQMVRIEKASDSSRVINISPDDLAFSALSNIEPSTPILSNAKDHQWLFKSLWDYVLSVEVLSREYGKQDGWRVYLDSMIARILGGKEQDDAKRLLRISLGADGSPQTLTQRMIDLIKEVHIEAGPISVSMGRKGPDKTGQLKLLSQINSVAKGIGALLEHEYCVLIDDLDLHWVDAPVQNEFIAALFTSLRKMNSPPRLRFLVAMREDIYSRLPVVDKDKVRDAICQITWNKATIKKMIEKRVCYTLNCNMTDIWGNLFPSNGFETMWAATSGRPRELIGLSGLTIETARSNSHTCVADGDMVEAQRLFSTQRIRELASQHRHDYPGLDQLVFRFAGWPKEFHCSKLEEFAENVWVDVDDRKPIASQYSWAGGYATRGGELAEILLRVGVLLIKASRTSRPQPLHQHHPVNLHEDSWFAIHPMYQAGLDLVGD